MSEYEKINANVKVQMAVRRQEAIKRIILVLVALIVAMGAFIGLKAIGFISGTFAVILASITICIAAFKTGYIWHDIKF